MAEQSGNTTAGKAFSPVVFERSLRTSTEVGPACIALAGMLQRFGYPERACFAVHLACEEALANALRHGNREDPTKEVRLACQVGPEMVRIEVEDEGEGFDPSALPDPTAPENLDRESGRGVLLMHAYMDHVEFQGRGNRVVLIRKR